MRTFFEMEKVERRFLALLLFFSALSFLPWWRQIHFAGMSLFGWLMAALMVLSPAAALAIFLREQRRPR